MVVSIGQVGTSFRSNVDASRFRRHHLEKGGEEGQTIRTVEGPIRRAKGGKRGNEGGKVKGKTQGNPIARNNWVELGARISNPFNPCP